MPATFGGFERSRFTAALGAQRADQGEFGQRLILCRQFLDLVHGVAAAGEKFVAARAV